MRVRAKELGYYGHKRRHPGQEFILEPIKRIRKDKDGNPKEVTISEEQQFSERWMEKVDVVVTKKKEKPEVVKEEAL